MRPGLEALFATPETPVVRRLVTRALVGFIRLSPIRDRNEHRHYAIQNVAKKLGRVSERLGNVTPSSDEWIAALADVPGYTRGMRA